jgi:hypothetical protein
MLARTEETLPRVTESLRALLTSLIDYAGLFPPAALPMETALQNFDAYRRGEHAWALGRFVVPASRLADVPSGFPVSVLVNDPKEMPEADTIEMKAASAREIERIAKAAGDRTVYVETMDLTLLDAIAHHGLRAKVRTGGVTAEAFPHPDVVARFITACMTRCLPFKATAGLHHPVRCVKPLTYEQDAPCGTMHGFVNVFMAAALVENASEMLLDPDPRSFAFDDHGASWRDRRVTTTELATMRQYAISFGSCSFEEPIADLQELRWL